MHKDKYKQHCQERNIVDDSATIIDSNILHVVIALIELNPLVKFINVWNFDEANEIEVQ